MCKLNHFRMKKGKTHMAKKKNDRTVQGQLKQGKN